MDERQILADAKVLITQKRYQEARQMLKGIAHHPTAQQWLAKLDEIAPPVVSPFIMDDDDPFWAPIPAIIEPTAPSSASNDSLFMSEEEKFERVKGLLRDKKYDEARQILMALPDNPSAQKLLFKLNQVAPPLTAESFAVSPSPTRQSNPPISDPFGKPISDPFGSSTSDSNPFAPSTRPASNPRSTSSRPPSDPFGASADNSNPFAPSTISRPASNPLGAPSPAPSNPFDDANDNPFATPDADPFGINYEIVPLKPNESLALLQNSGSRSFEKNARRPSKSREARQAEADGRRAMGRAALIGFMFAFIGLGGLGVMAGLGNLDLSGLFGKDETFENDDMQLTYSNDWRSVDLDSRQDCRDAVGTCVLFLEARGNAVAARLQNLDLLQGSHQTTINVLWDGYQHGNVGLHMVGEAISLKIDGQDAVQWYMTWRGPEGYDMYGMVLYMPTSHSVLEFSAWGNSQAIFADEYPEIEAIVRSIQIKQPPR